MKWLKLVLVIVLAGFLGRAVWQRYFVSEETRIKRVIARGEQAVEEGNLLKLEGVLTADYSDQYGLDKSSALGAVRQFRTQYPSVFIHISDLAITVGDDRQTAQATLIARVLAGPAEDPAATEIRNERLRVHLRQTDQGWKVFRVETPELKFD